MTDVKTHPTLTVIKGHKRGNKVFRERFVNSVGDHGEKQLHGYCQDGKVI